MDALRRGLALSALFWLIGTAAAEPSAPSAPPRIEARSGELLAVGTLHADTMTIHVSRIVDNAPVRDAAVALLLRGSRHPATAQTDGSYSVTTPDLALPGAAAVAFEIERPGLAREELKGTLPSGAAADGPGDKNSSRQLGWWVLNFAVCIGFLLLWRRRKGAET